MPQWIKDIGTWALKLTWWQWVIIAVIAVIVMWFAAYTGIFNFVPDLLGA